MTDIAVDGCGGRRHVRGPWALRRGTWWGVIRRTVIGFQTDNLADRAAALTYYSVISLFPGVIVVSALLGSAGPSATRSLIDTINEIGAGGDNSVVVLVLEELQRSRAVAGPVAIIGLATALWTASGYIGAFVRAINAVYDTEEGRPLWKTVPLQLGLTVVIVVLVVVCAVGVLVSGQVAETVGHWLGLGPTAISVWGIAKWPVLAVLVSVVFALLYWAAPNARQLGLHWLTPGSMLAVAVWIAASAGFAFYATHFGSYNKVYGSLAGAVVFLVWVWLSNVAILLGAEFDAELARGRRIEEGGSAQDKPILPPRDEP
ncbi:YihY/virulence factor BrkB family protein [Nocardia bovistercoris]|uniref:YihY/virulence factor BrkB family protein n=1 Tax=Nocardia bovistercoris TaxID=2785916 RepID=A0A931IG38_9NOCA|nr:YihY/virulence factor BrkB family protein [Nocardia bovistercoris]MBH0780909.1 YihY/virulence factor BrkB family protein [Nocardia bovistercoris]